MAVICQRDGQYQLMFRVADMRTKSHIIGTSIRALMVRNRLTTEGELIPLCQYPLALDNETSPVDDTYMFMVWPVTIVHKIDESSPLWDISAEQLFGEHFEIIVILEGTVESTGSSTQVRTSYLPTEIHWGQRLAPLVTFHQEDGCYTIDYSRFHDTLPVSMPEYSAKTWTSRRNSQSYVRRGTSDDHMTDFTSAPRLPEKPASRIINKLFRRRVDSSGVQLKLQRLHEETKRTEQEEHNSVWTVADPSKPSYTLNKRPSQQFSMV
jgi:hypothetical protein